MQYRVARHSFSILFDSRIRESFELVMVVLMFEAGFPRLVILRIVKG